MAGIGFLGIRRPECYPGTVHERVIVTQKKGSTYPPPEFCDAKGPGLDQVLGSLPDTHESTTV